MSHPGRCIDASLADEVLFWLGMDPNPAWNSLNSWETCVVCDCAPSIATYLNSCSLLSEIFANLRSLLSGRDAM